MLSEDQANKSVEIRVKGRLNYVLKIINLLKSYGKVLSEKGNYPNHKEPGVRRYLTVELDEDSPTWIIQTVQPGRNGQTAPAEPRLIVCGDFPVWQVGQLIDDLVAAATQLAQGESQ